MNLLQGQLLFAIFILFLICHSTAKRRGGSRVFESRPGMGGSLGRTGEEGEDDKDDEDDNDYDEPVETEKQPSESSEPSRSTLDENKIGMKDGDATKEVEVKDKVMELLDGANYGNINGLSDQELSTNITYSEIKKTIEESEYSEKKLFWIDTTYKALDFGLNVSAVPECEKWRNFWSKNSTDTFEFIVLNDTNKYSDYESLNASVVYLVEYELIDSEKRLMALNLGEELLEENDAVGILYLEICGNYERQYIYNTPEDARKIGIGLNSLICDPFKRELHPDSEALANLTSQLNEFIRMNELNQSKTDDIENQIIDKKINLEDILSSKKVPNYKVVKRIRRKIEELDSTESKEKQVEDKAKGQEADADWLEAIEISKQILEELIVDQKNDTSMEEVAWIQIDVTDETNPLLIILSSEAAKRLNLFIPEHYFKRYEKVGLHLPGICADYIPTAIDAFNASIFDGVDIEGPIGVNITALELAGVNLTDLAEKLRNDTEVDKILSRSNETARVLGGSYIIPVLNKNQYDPFSAPIVFQGSSVVVRFGIYIESVSNFQTSTMDYDMDIYLILAWRDVRLVNPYDKPILVKEEEILEKIWRPDPFFDAKEAEFHEVTFLNFLMRIYNDGLVLYETRIKLKPACNLVLCKYPHDKQTCELKIKSFAYPIESVRFEWFTNKRDAIDKNPDVRLPELYIDKYEPTMCNRTRKSGEFACLRAVFRLKRDVGFHIAQTYIPTSLALMFSWVGVWLPEEFMEGRIGVAITVLLTLSTESAGAREHLPSVSYLKAIDLWFGYVTGFVFLTLLQTLFVIGFDKRANQFRKWAMKKRIDLSTEAREALMNKANKYHKIGRYIDNFCRVFYPLSFVLFLIMYYFVFTEGRQDDCIADR